MLIAGDFAYPFGDLNTSASMALDGHHLLINCEGYLVDQDNKESVGIYNHVKSIAALREDGVILALANNHVTDTIGGIQGSLDIANTYNTPTVGVGLTLEESIQPHIVNEAGVTISIIAAGWDVIGCVPATRKSAGVAPLNSSMLLKLVQQQRALSRTVVLYLHWGYELEIYPHPLHRHLAHAAIDAGASLVVGCHAHCLQGYEEYKGKAIFYGIGNAVFKQGFYFNSRLKFPEICDKGLLLEWNALVGTVRVRDIWLEDNRVVVGEACSPTDHQRLVELSSFSGMSKHEYLRTFKMKRRKRKMLPVFKEADDTFAYQIKRVWVMCRARLIRWLFKLRLKGTSR